MSDRFAGAADPPKSAVDRTADWKEVTAHVISSTYRYASLSQINAEDQQDNSYFVVTFGYTVNGVPFVDEYKRSEALDAGDEIAILYNPAKPSENNLSDPTQAPNMGMRIVLCIVGGLLAAALIYLAMRYGWPDGG